MKSLRQEAKECGMPYTTASYRINKRGWTRDRALSEPVTNPRPKQHGATRRCISMSFNKVQGESLDDVIRKIWQELRV